MSNFTQLDWFPKNDDGTIKTFYLNIRWNNIFNNGYIGAFCKFGDSISACHCVFWTCVIVYFLINGKDFLLIS